MKQVVGAGLSCNIVSVLAYSKRKVGAIPVAASVEVEIEIVHLFEEGGLDTRMLRQKLVKKGGATFLCSDYDEVGQGSHWSGA